MFQLFKQLLRKCDVQPELMQGVDDCRVATHARTQASSEQQMLSADLCVLLPRPLHTTKADKLPGNAQE